MNDNLIYVLYHAHCTDGTGAKYAAWKKFKDSAVYKAVQYGKPVPDMVPGSEVYIVDFSYPRDVLEELQSVHKSVVVLDHHKTAEEALKGCPGCTFDMNKSGCVLAWEHFHPDEPVPMLLQNIQDRDIWKFELRNSKEVHAGLQLLKGDMHKWDLAAADPNKPIPLGTHQFRYHWIVENGRTLLQKQDMTVEAAVKGKVKVIDFAGYKCGITNYTDLASEIGNAICLDRDLNVDFALVYCITKDDDVLCSLRSIGDFDVTKIAGKFGGGGHQKAAGCKISVETLCKILKGMM